MCLISDEQEKIFWFVGKHYSKTDIRDEKLSKKKQAFSLFL